MNNIYYLEIDVIVLIFSENSNQYFKIEYHSQLIGIIAEVSVRNK